MSDSETTRPPVDDASHDTPVADRTIIVTLWPAVVAAILGLVPFTVFSTFLVPIAESVAAGTAAVGTLRGLGGVAAVLTAAAFAPLIGRWNPRVVASAALTSLALAAAIGTIPALPALVVFCIGIGSATAVLLPALLTIAAGTYADPRDGGRAATIVTSGQTLAAVMAAPVIGALAIWAGWRGVLWLTAVLALLAAASMMRRARVDTRTTPRGETYLGAFRRLRRRADLLGLVGIGALRTASFMGYLSFLAVQYDSRFDFSATAFTAVWTLSGISFFAGNFLAGRWIRRSDAGTGTTRLVLWICLAGVGLGVVVVFLTTNLAVALVMTVVMGAGHAVIAAQLTTSIAAQGGDLTATTYSLHGAGMSLGVFVGASAGGLGLAVAGDLGLALTLAAPVMIAAVLVPVAIREPARSIA
ncbi:MFS transporter [Gordonia sp. NPDC058843]|uniref:MFS transporter n=1 Tax=Gordonia sp. NPDC058843 TaxID=3346648 RepID=UPI00368AEF36